MKVSTRALCTQRLRAMSIFKTAIASPVVEGSCIRSIEGASGGRIDVLQTSRTSVSTTSILSIGIPTTSRVLSSTPRTSTPPLAEFANAASSSANESRGGPSTLSARESNFFQFEQAVFAEANVFEQFELRVKHRNLNMPDGDSDCRMRVARLPSPCRFRYEQVPPANTHSPSHSIAP